MLKYHWHDVFSTLQPKLRDFLNSDNGAFIERVVYLQFKDSKRLAHEIKGYENGGQETDPEKYAKLHNVHYLWSIIGKWSWKQQREKNRVAQSKGLVEGAGAMSITHPAAAGPGGYAPCVKTGQGGPGHAPRKDKQGKKDRRAQKKAARAAAGTNGSPTPCAPAGGWGWPTAAACRQEKPRAQETTCPTLQARVLRGRGGWHLFQT